MDGGDKHMERTCIICGKSFTPTSPRQAVCTDKHYRPCPICGKLLEFKRPSDKVKCCSKSCSDERTRRKYIEKYGVDHPMKSKIVQEHYKASMLEKFGVDSPLKSDTIKNKAIETNRERFGTDWALSNKGVKDKAKQTMTERYGGEYTLQCNSLVEKVKTTNLDKYGCENAMQNSTIHDMAEATNRIRYGVSNPMSVKAIKEKAIASRISNNGAYTTKEMWHKAQQKWLEHYGLTNPSFSPEIINKITHTFKVRYGVKRAIHVPEFRKKMIATSMKRYGCPYYILSSEYRNNYHVLHKSNINLNFSKKLSVFNIPHSFEYTIGTRAYDIALTDKNILIEIDPTYTHNAIGNHWNKDGISSEYHLLKSNLAKDNGCRCIHIFDWDDPLEIIKLICNKSPIYARTCSIQRLTTEQVVTFTNLYHLQGSCKGQTEAYGLFYNQELVQIMSFGKPRYNKKYEWELLRLCTLPQYYIVGGAERLFKAFINSKSPNSIISYCDLSKFSGDVYERIGFTHVYNTAPTKVWSKGSEKITNNLLLQRGFDQLFKTNYGKGTNNEELMISHGWLPVYDCGQGVYVWNK